MTPAEYKELRERLGTQAEVALRLGVTRETIANRETGRTRVTREAWLALVLEVERRRLAEDGYTPATSELMSLAGRSRNPWWLRDHE